MLKTTHYSGSFLTILVFILVISFHQGFSQVGLGAEGVINYPGVLASEKNDIRFKPGFGYGFFVRHDVYDSGNWKLDFRYAAVISKHSAELPRSGNTDYEFSNFSIDFIIRILSEEYNGLYTGLSANLLSAVSNNKYLNDYSAESVYPSVIFGYGYVWAEGFDFFVELKTGFGSTKAGPEKIPVTGPALHTGITMYISE